MWGKQNSITSFARLNLTMAQVFNAGYKMGKPRAMRGVEKECEIIIIESSINARSLGRKVTPLVNCKM